MGQWNSLLQAVDIVASTVPALGTKSAYQVVAMRFIFAFPINILPGSVAR